MSDHDTSKVKLAPPPPPVDAWADHAAPQVNARSSFQFSIEQLAIIYGTTRATIKKKIGDALTARSHHRVGDVYDLANVTELIDIRKPSKGVQPGETYAPADWFTDDGQPTLKMPPDARRKHFQALDMEQAYHIKKAKNDLHDKTSLDRVDTEKSAAAALKTIVKHLDNLPDVLEREGVISPDDIHVVIQKVDKMRSQLIKDMDKLRFIVHGE